MEMDAGGGTGTALGEPGATLGSGAEAQAHRGDPSAAPTPPCATGARSERGRPNMATTLRPGMGRAAACSCAHIVPLGGPAGARGWPRGGPSGGEDQRYMEIWQLFGSRRAERRRVLGAIRPPWRSGVRLGDVGLRRRHTRSIAALQVALFDSHLGSVQRGVRRISTHIWAPSSEV